MSGRVVTGAGLERATSGCPAAGLCVQHRLRCGSRDIGCDALAAGYGSRVTGNNLSFMLLSLTLVPLRNGELSIPYDVDAVRQESETRIFNYSVGRNKVSIL